MRDDSKPWPRRAMRDDTADKAVPVVGIDAVPISTYEADSDYVSTTTEIVLRAPSTLVLGGVERPVFQHARRGIAPVYVLPRARQPLALTAGPAYSAQPSNWVPITNHQPAPPDIAAPPSADQADDEPGTVSAPVYLPPPVIRAPVSYQGVAAPSQPDEPTQIPDTTLLDDYGQAIRSLEDTGALSRVSVEAPPATPFGDIAPRVVPIAKPAPDAQMAPQPVELAPPPADVAHPLGSDAAPKVAAEPNNQPIDSAAPMTVDEDLPVAQDETGRLGRALLHALFSALVPMSGLIASRRRRLAVAVVSALVVLAVAAVLVSLAKPGLMLDIATSPGLVKGLAAAVCVAAGLWVVNIVWTYLAQLKGALTQGQRVLGSVAVAVLSLLVAIVLITGGKNLWQLGTGVESVFGATKSATVPSATPGDPWGGKDRVNVLLLGNDSGAGNPVGSTTVSSAIIVASIDVATGDTLFIQVPPNMTRAPFPADSELAGLYPNGFANNLAPDDPDFRVGAMWNRLSIDNPGIFPTSTFPGADAMKLSIGSATGLTISYFIMVDMDGLQRLVDAMGGVNLNVDFDLATGGGVKDGCQADHYVKQGGDQKLDGTDALWFGRSLCNDPQGDFGLMLRQACLLQALITQLNPSALYGQVGGIASSTGAVATDIPLAMLRPFISLLGQMKQATLARLSFGYQTGFVPNSPNYIGMKQRVLDALAEMPVLANTSAAPPETQNLLGAVDLSQACGYNPIE